MNLGILAAIILVVGGFMVYLRSSNALFPERRPVSKLVGVILIAAGMVTLLWVSFVSPAKTDQAVSIMSLGATLAYCGYLIVRTYLLTGVVFLCFAGISILGGIGRLLSN